MTLNNAAAVLPQKRSLRARGISYDTGFVYNGAISPERCDAEVIKRELQIIRDDLHCNAVRVIGGDPERLELAATYAAHLGLEVWFSPYPLELTTEEMLSLFADCAARGAAPGAGRRGRVRHRRRAEPHEPGILARRHRRRAGRDAARRARSPA